jgi:hypothetical protein
VRLSAKLREWWFWPLWRLAAFGLPGIYIAIGAWKVARHGFRASDGSWNGGSLMIAAGLFVWMLLLLLYAQHRRHHRELEQACGEYYEYQGQRIRAEFDEQDQLWLAAADLAACLGKSSQDLHKLLAGIDTANMVEFNDEAWLSETGVAQLLSKRTGRPIALLERFLLAEVFAVHNKRRAAGALHYRQRPMIYNTHRR